MNVMGTVSAAMQSADCGSPLTEKPRDCCDAICGSRALQQKLDSGLLGVADMGADRGFRGTGIV
jgi:hypothetical protein